CRSHEHPVPLSGCAARRTRATNTDRNEERENKRMMIPRHRPLSPRDVLRGAGVAIGLPWLEAMVPSALAASAPAKSSSPVRMAVLYMPNGVNTSQWAPEGSGRDFQLSPTLASLQDLKDQLVVV